MKEDLFVCLFFFKKYSLDYDIQTFNNSQIYWEYIQTSCDNHINLKCTVS